jgi:ABC-2 type transport system ATP-binding protein
LIEVQNLTKQFGSTTVVNDLSFELGPGSVLGFLGPNGAGKSTTMKMITGFLTPSSGSVHIQGYDISSHRQAAQAEMGYLPEGAPSYEEMTVAAFLKFIAKIRGARGALIQQWVDRVTDTVSLRAVLHQRIETLSKGYKRRVGLAQALIHDPSILILDEPTDGLDPNQKHQVRQMILDLSDQKIVIISTHILEEVSAVCSRAMIINAGEIVLDDTPEGLCQRAEGHLSVSLRINGVGDEALSQACSQLPQCGRVALIDGGGVLVYPAEALGDPLAALQEMMRANHWQAEWIQQHEGQLDELFRDATGGRLQ